MLLRYFLISNARVVRDHVERIPTRSFVSRADLPEACHAIDCELARMASRNELVRVYKGLYWKGPQTRAGMPAPAPMDVGLRVAGSGSGPAGFSAAASLGLTTQVPSVDVVAVAGRAPRPPKGVAFVSRSADRGFRSLQSLEVAVLELMRDGTRFIEVDWERAAAVVEQLAESGAIRPQQIGEQIHSEHHVAARGRWRLLAERIGS
ncbi:hypothetical protein [Candidatus Poriferisodalis sp.]|uniref:hypothetical protein n=1 Tax=Candidatus Poriferisodalis sp. TaxID=3101277 RepID=UPI003D0B938A